jgi:HEAT repeat protein
MNKRLPLVSAVALTIVCLSACGGPPATNLSATNSLVPPTGQIGAALYEPDHVHPPAVTHSPIGQGNDERPTAMDDPGVVRREQALAEVRVMLWDEDLEVREAALDVFLELRVQDTATLSLLVTDADAEMRQSVVDALTDMGGPVAESLLQNATYDPHPAVRQAALEGLEELGIQQH